MVKVNKRVQADNRLAGCIVALALIMFPCIFIGVGKYKRVTKNYTLLHEEVAEVKERVLRLERGMYEK